jgi:hypothetical protein
VASAHPPQPDRWLYVDRRTLAHVFASGPASPGQEPLTAELLERIRAAGKRAVDSPSVPATTKETIRRRWREIRAWAEANLSAQPVVVTEPHVCRPPAEMMARVGQPVRWPASGVAGTIHSVSCSGSVYIERADGCFTTVPWDQVDQLEGAR